MLQQSLPWKPELRATLSQAPFNSGLGTLILTHGPLHLWKKFANQYNVDEGLQEAITEELRSSMVWQRTFHFFLLRRSAVIYTNIM
jgi:hypothetical protein